MHACKPIPVQLTDHAFPAGKLGAPRGKARKDEKHDESVSSPTGSSRDFVHLFCYD